MEFEPWYLEEMTHISLTFMTTEADGVLLYSAREYNVAGLVHYIKLYVQAGTLRVCLVHF